VSNRARSRSASSLRRRPIKGCRRPVDASRGALPVWSIGLIFTAVLAIGSSAGVRAHEAGSTRVIATFAPDRTYAIELTTDASTLLARLEVARKQPRSSPGTIADYRRGFAALCDEVARHVEASFDATAVRVLPACIVDDAVTGPDPAIASLGVTVRFAGSIPAGAAHFSWQYGLTSTPYAFVLVSSDGHADETTWLEGDQKSPPVPLDRVAAPVARTGAARKYFRLGFVRFLPNGAAQVLFVLGIVLLNRRISAIVWQVGAFSLAHSLALAFTPYGSGLPPPIVEPLIVLSIICLAVDNLMSRDLSRLRLAMIFGFGLIHGVAFAETLRQVSLPGVPRPGDQLWFNAGIETGQCALIVAACAIVGGWAAQRERHRQMVGVPVSAALALAGLLWILRPISL
jgi:hydrogenase/urease accessory protein HupE